MQGPVPPPERPLVCYWQLSGGREPNLDKLLDSHFKNSIRRTTRPQAAARSPSDVPGLVRPRSIGGSAALARPAPRSAHARSGLAALDAAQAANDRIDEVLRSTHDDDETTRRARRGLMGGEHQTDHAASSQFSPNTMRRAMTWSGINGDGLHMLAVAPSTDSLVSLDEHADEVYVHRQLSAPASKLPSPEKLDAAPSAGGGSSSCCGSGGGDVAASGGGGSGGGGGGSGGGPPMVGRRISRRSSHQAGNAAGIAHAASYENLAGSGGLLPARSPAPAPSSSPTVGRRSLVAVHVDKSNLFSEPTESDSSDGSISDRTRLGGLPEWSSNASSPGSRSPDPELADGMDAATDSAHGDGSGHGLSRVSVSALQRSLALIEGIAGGGDIDELLPGGGGGELSLAFTPTREVVAAGGGSGGGGSTSGGGGGTSGGGGGSGSGPTLGRKVLRRNPRGPFSSRVDLDALAD